MENLRDEKLEEIKSMLQEVSKRLAEAEAKIAELEAQGAENEAPAAILKPVAAPAPAAAEPIDMDDVISMDDIVDDWAPEAAPVAAEPVVAEPAAAPEPVAEPVQTQPVAPAPKPVVETPVAEAKEETLADIFGEASDEGTLNAKHRASRKNAVHDMMAQAEAWRTDLPGSPVKDIRSAISLNDRIRFIRELFAEDAEKFQSVMEKINGMETLDEAVDYIKENNPSWNFGSDVVYRFMMAVRRKVR